jgi:acyl-CoA reductase-like NAD-dependent aldehyde dehydrogenase
MSTQLPILKTYKLYVGGNFVRGESGRCLVAASAKGEHLANVCHASRKDFRDGVAAARAAFEGWAKKSAYLRGQILYRAAEMLQPRASELAAEIARSTGAPLRHARREVAFAIDRLVYFAGWTDKYQAAFSSVNPVASSHFNFTMPEPTGVVAVVAPDDPPLLPLASLIAPVLLSGNTAVVLASERYPLPALTFCEILATSDLPAGAINVLAGRRQELAESIAGHLDVNAIVDGAGDPELAAQLQAGTAHNLKRYADHSLAAAEWFGDKGEDPYRILDTTEFKTAWHPIGL